MMTSSLDRLLGNAESFEEAHHLIKPYIIETPSRHSKQLSDQMEVFLKLENLQHTGSFKLRGVTHKLLSLGQSQRRQTLIAASTGNHGAAFAHMVKKLGLKGKLYVPKTITQVKLDAIKKTGIDFECVGQDCVETEVHAIHAAKSGVLVGPYNDPQIILGQGTVAVELLQQNRIDAVLVPVGGGGLISGIAAYIKNKAPHVRVIGCQPSQSAVMYHSINAGTILTMDSHPTLSDATAGGIEPQSITFDLCQRYVDDFVLLDEPEIRTAIEWLWRHEHMAVEGGAALPLAALWKTRQQYIGRRVALIISGSKLDPRILKELEAQND